MKIASARNRTVALLMGAPLLFLFARLPSQEPQNRSKNEKPVALVVEKKQGRVTYKVDSKPAKPDLLYILNQVRNQRGPDDPLVVLIDSRVPMDEISNVGGVAGKAGLKNLRFFVFNRETDRMAEIKFGPGIPFTTNPPLN